MQPMDLDRTHPAMDPDANREIVTRLDTLGTDDIESQAVFGDWVSEV